GLTEARWVDPAEAARMVPVLNVEDVLGCTFCPTDGLASPADVTAGYVAAARRHGARLKEGMEVIAIDIAGGRVQGVRTTAGDGARERGDQDRVGGPVRNDAGPPGDPRARAGGRGVLVRGRVQRSRIHAGARRGSTPGAAAPRSPF